MLFGPAVSDKRPPQSPLATAACDPPWGSLTSCSVSSSGESSSNQMPPLHRIRAKLFPMKRVNVTLAIEEDLLQEARAVAARSHTSVNEMVRNYLQQVVGKEQRRLAAFDRIRGLLERPSVTIGGRLPSRDELHER